MKNRTKTNELTVEIPTWAWNRITKHLREELEIERSEEIIAATMASDLVVTWTDDLLTWTQNYFYPDRETALRVANRFFERYPRNSPIELKYTTRGIGRFETFSSPHHVPPVPAAAARAPELIDVTLKLAPAQHAVFAAIGKLAEGDASAGETILALACDRTEMFNGHNGQEGPREELNTALRTFGVQRQTPEDNYWGATGKGAVIDKKLVRFLCTGNGQPKLAKSLTRALAR